MDKSALKKLAAAARRELIGMMTARAALFGLKPDGIHGMNGEEFLSPEESRLLASLRRRIRAEGFDTVTEDAACAWFLRIAAIRLMEVNRFLPGGECLFRGSPEDEKSGIESVRVIEKRRELSGILPDIFGGAEDDTELLLPECIPGDSALCRILNETPDEWFDLSSESGQLGAVGILYQYYQSERHEAAVNPLHRGMVGKEELPAATQLFTTGWIVRFLTDNSVGRYWAERHPESTIASRLPYLVPLSGENSATFGEKITPRDVTVFDPCVGSGHFLMYAFDLLMGIYTECGYSRSEAACEIVRHNLFGLDIDRRVAGIARFCVMMKARRYDRDFFSRGILPRIYEITESGGIDGAEITQFVGSDKRLSADVSAILERMTDAKEYGSLLSMPDVDFERIRKAIGESSVSGELRELLGCAELMSGKYAAVVTNPPYFNRYDDKLKAFLSRHFPESSGDLFSVFMERNAGFCRENGYTAFLTPYVWMFIRKYEALRRAILRSRRIVTLIQFEYSAYEDATVPLCAFVMANDSRPIPGGYFRLTGFRGGMDVQKGRVEEALENPENRGYYFETEQSVFGMIPSAPFAFWAGDEIISAFRSGRAIGDIALARNGMKTGDNRRFLRLWWEVSPDRLRLNCHDIREAVNSGGRWFPYNKGGEYRKWYGNNDYVVDWENAGERIFRHAGEDCRHVQDYPDGLKFTPSLTWSLVTSGKPSFRYKECCLSDIAGMSLYGGRDTILRALGLLNSTAAAEILQMLAPTLNCQAGDIARIPVPPGTEEDERIPALVERCVALSREDWDRSETSWDFRVHPLVRGESRISDAFSQWQAECGSRFRQLKQCEEELNRVFLSLYGLEGRLPYEVGDSDISLRRADAARDVRSLISYAVGCMFGRFTIPAEFRRGSGSLLPPENDGIIPLSGDGMFANDIMSGFIDFLKVVYGEETLEDNIRFIAGALGRKGPPEEAIRGYFLGGFFAYHCVVYRKRPVYWLFDSGRRGAFRCLAYYHSLRPRTASDILEKYLSPTIEACRAEIRAAEERADDCPSRERAVLLRKLNSLRGSESELLGFERRLRAIAGMNVLIDPDDGVTANYERFRGVVAAVDSRGKEA